MVIHTDTTEYFISYNKDSIDNNILSSITFIRLSYLLCGIKSMYSEKIETEVSALFNMHMKGLILFTLKSVEISVLDGSRNNCLNSTHSISLVFFLVCTWGMETGLSNHENIVIIEKILAL